MKSVMTHQFSQIPRAEIPRSSFKRSHGCKTTLDSGYLVPVYVDEALPGDTFACSANMFARLSTPIVPIMDNAFLDVFFFAVPIRLVWDNFVRMMGQRDNPDDSIDYLVPQITSPEGGWSAESLSDYFGLPINVAGLSVSSLWHRAYNLIWNEWFRDENLQDSVAVPKGDGPDNNSDFVLLRRGKRHDYFTSCLPWPQKGDGVSIPLGGEVPVRGDGKTLGLCFATEGEGDPVFGGLSATTSSSNLSMLVQQYGADNGTVATSGMTNPMSATTSRFSVGVTTDEDKSGLVGDLAQATAVTINTLREAFQLQRLLERDARGGTRYTELIRSHFGVVSPDARLQRPEYLGGGSFALSINAVAQTSGTSSGTTPQGNLAATGVFAGRSGFTKSFTEHTLILGLVNVRADLNYQQGIPRMFSRRGRYDFYWPALSHLGEQAVLNKEIYAAGGTKDEEPFGYQERWAEYRYKPSQITGKLRSTYTNTLDVWHLAQYFESRPALGSAFIEDNPPFKRVLALEDEPEFIFDSYFDLTCVRPMPVYSVPGLIDHF